MIKGAHAIIFTDCLNHGTAWSRAAGAYRIATELRNMNLRVQVIDFFALMTLEGPDLIKMLLTKFVGTETIFVGFSSTFFNNSVRLHRNKLSIDRKANKLSYNQLAYTPHYGAAISDIKEIVDHVKAINSTVDIVFGGTKASNLEAPYADVICVGYGEKHIVDYVNFRLKKNPFFQGRRNKLNQLILDYNNTSDGFDFNRSQIIWDPSDCIQPGETLPIEVSRGCIFRCKFCSFVLNGRSKFDYIKDYEVLKQEFIHNYETYKITKYIFSDDTYNDSTVKLEHMNKIVQELPFTLEFGTYARLDLITAHREQADLLKENGLRAVFFGIESLNYESAKSIGKGLKSEKIIETLHWLREKWGNDVITNAGFILGLPYDTISTMEGWLEKLMDHRFPLHTFELSPLVIQNLDLITKVAPSIFDGDPGKYGYIFDDPLNHKSWVNSKYGTSFNSVDDLAQTAHDYALINGRLRYAAQTAMVVAGLGISYDNMLRHSRANIDSNFHTLNKTMRMYFSYLSELVKLEEI